MSDAVETKILSMLDALQDGVTTVAGQAVKYAPDVMDAALVVTRMDGIQTVVCGVLALLVCATSVYAVFKGWKLSQDSDHQYDVAPVFLSLGGIIVGIISGLSVFCTLFDVWTYVAIFEPKLYIAHQIVQQVLK